ncbi:MAG: aminoacyl--tRNA ligase-related protein [bacterium]|nr:aminoacyl--tRNA ligase-related protein [bacterium]
MKQSELFSKTQRSFPKNEESVNAQLLLRAGYVEKLMAGVYSYLPLGLLVLRNIERIVREEMNALGAVEVLLPSLHPKENWQTTGRWKTMDDLYKLKDRGGREFALAGTHEEVIVPLLKKFVSSYKDLPLAVYQIQNKFRDELRAKSGLLRGREFLMKDLYSFHANENDMLQYYEKVKVAYRNIFSRVGLKAIETEASGGTFSDFSHEYQVLTEAGEDEIIYCAGGDYAANAEISQAKEGKQCDLGHGPLKKAKSIEVGNIFPLKDKYSKAFNLSFKDEKGKEHLVQMGCYGIGLGRLLGTIVEVHHDKGGIVWPSEVAPFQIHLLSLSGGEKAAKRAYEELQAKGIEVLFDDREASPGEKLTDADLLGIPLRLVSSEKTASSDSFEVKKRDEEKIELVKKKDLVSYLSRPI